MKKETFSSAFPQIAEEWNYEKNELTPADYSPHSNKKVWWKCRSCGNEWQAIINGRTYGQGCPVCARNKRIKSFRENNYLQRGINDLKTLMPDLAAEWDYPQNENITPRDFTLGSKEKVWWKCKTCGNEWQSTIKNRAQNHSGCPKCQKHERTSFPEQALFYYISNYYPDAINSYTDIFPDNTELDIFIPALQIGIEYDGKAWHDNERARSKANYKYEICKNNTIKLLRVSEIKTDESLPSDYFVYRPENTTNSLNDIIEKVLSILNVPVDTVDTEKDRPKIMLQYIGYIQEKSISSKYPDAVKYWDTEKNGGITPDMVNSTSQVKYWWKCELGHSYKATPGNKLLHNNGCPVCSGHQLLSGFNDLSTRYPDIANEWDYDKNAPKTPDKVMPGSVVKYWWKCEKGHSFYLSPNNRTSHNSRCPYCTNRLILPGYNDLLTLRPDVAEMLDSCNDFSYTEVGIENKTKAYWKCSLGHKWVKRICDQVRFNSCPVCSGRVALEGQNDIITKYPKIAVDWDYTKNPIDPRTITDRCNEYVWWKCHKCGKEWYQKVNVRIHKNAGCPTCGYKEKLGETRLKTTIAKGNDLATKYPDIAAQWDYEKNYPLTPFQVSYGSNKKVWWVCPKGHSYQAWLTDRTGKSKTGCPYCSKKRKLEQ